MIHSVFRLLRVLLVALAAATVFIFGWICAVQAQYFAHPKRLPVTATPADYGFTIWREVSLTTTDGLSLSGWFIPPHDPQAKNPAILFVHGIAGNRLKFITEAQWLTQQGYAVLLFDLRNHGNSDGKVTTMGVRETEDVKTAFAYLSAQPEVDAERITLFGHSMGGSTAILAMAQLPQAQSLILDTAYTSVIDVTNDGVKALIGRPVIFGDIILLMTNWLTGEDLYTVRPIDVISTLAPHPILIMHGTADTTIFSGQAQTLYQAAQQPKSLWLLPGGGHGTLYQIDQVGYQMQVLNFLQKHP